MVEEWRRVVGFEERYMISSYGRIKILRGIKKGKIKKTRLDEDGYNRITLFDGSKYHMYGVHRLVATTFIPNPRQLPQVNHKDEDKLNNKVENLEWCDARYNNNYGSRVKRMAEAQLGQKRPTLYKKIKGINIKTGKKILFPSASCAEQELGIDAAHICWCCKGKRKSAGGYKWKYVKETQK